MTRGERCPREFPHLCMPCLELLCKTTELFCRLFVTSKENQTDIFQPACYNVTPTLPQTLAVGR